MKTLRYVLIGMLLVLASMLVSEVRSPTGMLSLADVNSSVCFRASHLGVVSGDTIFINDTVSQTAAGDCIVMDVADTVLDCQGNLIVGNPIGSAAIGIYADNVTATNCTIVNFTGVLGRGVVVNNARDAVVEHCSFSENGQITVSGSRNTVRYNTFNNPSVLQGVSSGVAMSSSGSVIGNTLRNGVTMTVLITGQNVTVRDNVVENITGEAFKVLSSHNVTLINNTARNITGFCFVVQNSTNITLTNNTVQFVNKLTRNYLRLFFPTIPVTSEAGFGFKLLDSNDTVLRGNTVNMDNSAGLFINNVALAGDSLVNTTIFNNSFSNTRECVFISNSRRSIISDNMFTNCSHKAVIIDGGRSNEVLGNTFIVPMVRDFYNYKRGVEFFRGANGTFRNNVIAGYGTGLYVYNVSSSLFEDSNISAAVHGVFSINGLDNDFRDINVTSSRVGLKFLSTNSSRVNDSDFTGTVHALMVDSSFFNNITFSAFSDGNGIFSHNSAFNNISNNTFLPNIVVLDNLVFDLFSNNNNGTGNTMPLGFIEINFASNNNVT